MSCIDNILIEIITKNFFLKRPGKKPKKNADRRGFDFSISNIIADSALKKSTYKKAKTTNKDRIIDDDFHEDPGEKSEDERGITFNGGYGTVSRQYGLSPAVKYADYGRIFSYLGAFRAKGMYEDLAESSINTAASNGDESSREMVSTETMEKAAKHFKYFVMGEVMGDVGFVPPFGLSIDSKEWEKYRLMMSMSVYRPLFALKRATA